VNREERQSERILALERETVRLRGRSEDADIQCRLKESAVKINMMNQRADVELERDSLCIKLAGMNYEHSLFLNSYMYPMNE